MRSPFGLEVLAKGSNIVGQGGVVPGSFRGHTGLLPRKRMGWGSSPPIDPGRGDDDSNLPAGSCRSGCRRYVACRKQTAQHRTELRQGPAAVAEGVLDPGRQFTEGVVVFGDEEERIVTEAALADPTGDVKAVVEGRCHGVITRERRGTGGFGYDPLFLIPEYHKTFGELSSRVKHALSHRARALAQLRPALRRLLHG